MTQLDAASYMQKAGPPLDEARLLVRERKTEGACSRAYYAMHDAAHAALIAFGHETPDAPIKTHHGLITAFGKTLVQSGQLDAALGRSFNIVQDTRQLAADDRNRAFSRCIEANQINTAGRTIFDARIDISKQAIFIPDDLRRTCEGIIDKLSKVQVERSIERHHGELSGQSLQWLFADGDHAKQQLLGGIRKRILRHEQTEGKHDLR